MSAAATTLPLAWLVARAAGLVVFGTLTLDVWLGLGMSTRLFKRHQAKLLGLHRTLAWTGLSTLALHMAALLADPTLHFGLGSVLVPFASPWRPAAVAAGIVSGWLMLMLAVSFRLRRLIGQRGWRRLHYASFAAWLLALVHGLTAGTDMAGMSGVWVTVIAGAPVLFMVLVRILSSTAPARRPVPDTR